MSIIHVNGAYGLKINKDNDIQNDLIIYLLYILFKIYKQVGRLRIILVMPLSEAPSSGFVYMECIFEKL